MASGINRRTALSVAGVGVIALIASCSAASQANSGGPAAQTPDATKTEAKPPAPQSTEATEEPEEIDDYEGEVKLESYDTSAGTFEPATRTSPAKNVPKPVKPNNINENSTAGLHSAIAFMAASLTYALTTGDSVPLKSAVDPDRVDKIMQKIGRVGTDQWFDNPQVTLNLKTAQPDQAGDTYIWRATMELSFGEYVATFGKSKDIAEDKKRKVQNTELVYRYENNSWRMAPSGSGSGTMII